MTTLEEIRAAALGLCSREREMLYVDLALSLEAERPSDYDEQWTAVIKRRIQELEDGSVKSISWDEVRERMDALFGPLPPLAKLGSRAFATNAQEARK